MTQNIVFLRPQTWSRLNPITKVLLRFYHRQGARIVRFQPCPSFPWCFGFLDVFLHVSSCGFSWCLEVFSAYFYRDFQGFAGPEKSLILRVFIGYFLKRTKEKMDREGRFEH